MYDLVAFYGEVDVILVARLFGSFVHGA